MNPAIRALLVLLAAALAAVAIILAAQFLFARLLENGVLAAWSPLLLESLFTVAVFGLLALVAVLGAWISGVRMAAGPAAPAAAGLGWFAGVVGLGLSVALAWLAGGVSNGDGESPRTLLLLGGAALTLLQTGAEELYFRGWMQPNLQAGWGRILGLFVTALAFAALHFVTGTLKPVSCANLLLAGLWFGLLAERSGGLALPVAAHFGWNWAEEMLFGVTPNPGVSGFGSIFDWELTGAPLWGGSAEGLNSSLSASFVLLALVIVTASWNGPARSTGRPGSHRSGRGPSRTRSAAPLPGFSSRSPSGR